MAEQHWACLVSSELQLLSLLEARAQAIVDGDRADVLVLGGYRPGEDLLSAATLAGLTLRRASRSDLLTLAPRRRLAIGDLFGQGALVLLAWGRVETVVVLEDGLATMAAMTRSPEDDMILRPRLDRAPPIARLVGGRAAGTLRDLASRDAMHWLINEASAALISHRSDSVSGQIHTHRFEVLRSLEPPVLDVHRTITRVVVGSSYATMGLINEAFYIEWLYRTLTAEPDTTLFIPHRRETDTAQHLALAAGALVSTSTASVERIALALGDLTRIDCLPSSPALSLRTLGRMDRVMVTPIPDDQWSDQTPSGFRSLVALATSVGQPL